MPPAAAAVALSLLALTAGSSLPPPLGEPFPGEWVVFKGTPRPSDGAPRFDVNVISEGHAYATIFVKYPVQGWSAPKLLSVSTLAAGATMGPPAGVGAGVPAGSLPASIGVFIPGTQEVLLVAMAYGDVAEWSTYAENLSLVEVSRGTGVRAYGVDDFQSGVGAGVETTFPGVDVAVDLEVQMDLVHTGFGYLGTVDATALLTNTTMATSIEMPDGTVETCPCQFFGDETREDFPVMNMVALTEGHYLVRADGVQTYTLGKLPILVVADIPDVTP